jgi:hypothetical protein
MKEAKQRRQARDTENVEEAAIFHRKKLAGGPHDPG